VVVGPEVTQGIWLSPSIFIGIIVFSINLIYKGPTKRLFILIYMIVIFALTSFLRHPLSTYIPSLLMLFSVMAPMCISRISNASKIAIQKGFLGGLCLTILIVWLEVGAQTAGQRGLYEIIANFFRPIEVRIRPHNYFIFYYRPYASFMEPAHLAIYLVMALFMLDSMRIRFLRELRLLNIATIIITGSFVGYFLLIIYVALKFYYNMRFMQKSIKNKIYKRLTIFTILMIVIVIVSLNVTYMNSIVNILFIRIEKVMTAIRTGSLVGSEASRVNAIIVLFEYWKMEGISGILFGTGYGNISEWLIRNYGHLETWATVSRGSVDNVFVAILIMTGFFGGAIYIYFVYSCFKVLDKRNTYILLFIFIAVNFATGFLISYLVWHLFSVIISTSRK
jgi:heme/copper-type cytochrome/quinol oxidase subunit 2